MTQSVRERALATAAQNFIDKVNNKTAISTRSYDEFRTALALPVESSPGLSIAVEALKEIGDTPGEDDEWDAVDKFHICRRRARTALDQLTRDR